MDIVDIFKVIRSNLWHSRPCEPTNTSKNWRPHGDSNPSRRRERASRIVVFISIFICLWTNCGQSYAIGFDAELGQSKFINSVGDGLWYQEPFEHSFDFTSMTWSAGVHGDLWRVGYVNLGRATSFAYAVPDDRDYDFSNHVCIQPCLPLSSYSGFGRVHGVYATLTPTVHFGQFSAFLEGGITLMKVDWKMYIQHDGQSMRECEPCAVDKWGVGRRYGAGIGFGNVSLVYSTYRGLGLHGADYDNAVPIFDRANTLTLRVAF